MNYSDFSIKETKKSLSKRSILEAMKSITEGKGDEALLHLSASLSMISEEDEVLDLDFLNVIKNENLSKEISKNTLEANITKTVPLFVSKEIENVGSSEKFKSYIENRGGLTLFTQIFMGSLQNDPKAIANSYLKFEEEVKSLFSKDFNGWSKIVQSL